MTAYDFPIINRKFDGEITQLVTSNSKLVATLHETMESFFDVGKLAIEQDEINRDLLAQVEVSVKQLIIKEETILNRNAALNHVKFELENIRMSKALEEYDLPAQLQKAESKVSTAAMVRRADQRYLEFQKKMWNEAGKLNELNQKEPGAAEDDLEEISVTLVTKCPITQKEFVKPVQNTKCKHSYEESSVIKFIRSFKPTMAKKKCTCPVPGCHAVLSEDELIENLDLLNDIKRMNKKKNQNANSETPDGYDFTQS